MGWRIDITSPIASEVRRAAVEGTILSRPGSVA